MKNTGLFLSFSLHREKANGSQDARGEHSSNNARARGADQRESCLWFSGLQGNSSAGSQVRSSKRTKPEVPICWVLFNRWASAWRVSPERTGATAGKQNYLRMVTYSFFPHAWRRHALCLRAARTVWCGCIQNAGHASFIVLGANALGVWVVSFANLYTRIRTDSDVAHETLSKQI